MAFSPDSSAIDRRARLALPPVPLLERAPSERIRDFDEVRLPWTGEMVRAEASRCVHCSPPPCVRACPLGNEIPLALWLVEQGELLEAAEVFLKTGNLSEVCGRVCSHPGRCEGVCPQGTKGMAPVAVGRIEAFLADLHREKRGWPGSRSGEAGGRAAVVGAGPAGLTVAELLAGEGHRVTVFEAWPGGGGVMRYGIPRFRLDHGLIRRRLAYLRQLGVEFVFNTRVEGEGGLRNLAEQGFRAVFLGTGAWAPADPGIPGSQLRGTHLATPFLVRANVEQNLRPSELEDPPQVGDRVAVIGGGDAAVDCGRTALRLGAREVVCYYLRTEEQMPGSLRDRDSAREEGVRFECLTAPLRILGGGKGEVRALRLVRMALVAGDASARPHPFPLAGSEFEVGVDTVVLATGYRADPRTTRGIRGLALRPDGLILVDESTGRTTRDGVWAGGYNVLGPGPVAEVVAQGRRAALDMHRYLLERNVLSCPEPMSR